MSTALGLALAFFGLTLVIGLLKTIKEGRAGLEEFDHAGFTFGAYWNGHTREVDGIPSVSTSELARIEIVDGQVVATPTRTISKTVS